jgi:RNA polymerase sigma factor (sigma-70 family)
VGVIFRNNRMSHFPETRNSLLARVQSLEDEDAWHEFVAIYRPVIFRLARQRGLQPADADDLAQRVFIAVNRAIGDWQPDPERGRFRAWLGTIARNAIINALSRRPPDAAAGGTSILELLESQPEPDDRARDALDREYRRSLFRWAARRVRAEFGEAVWNAFWLTTVQGRAVPEAAAELGRTTGAVYAARSRIMRRLREEVESCGGDSESSRDSWSSRFSVSDERESRQSHPEHDPA